MSEGWQQFLDIMLQDPQIRAAGLYGLDGTVWAASDDLKLPATEVKDLIAGIKDNARLRSAGAIIAGAKYRFGADYGDIDAQTVPGFIGKNGSNFAVGVMTAKSLIVVLAADGVAVPTEIQGLHLVIRQLLTLGF